MQTRQQCLDRIQALYNLFEAGEIPHLHHHEVNPGLEKSSRENYLYFTLPVTINFQRSSPALWQAALKTFSDPETNYLFFPEKTISTPRETIQRDMLKHKLALQPNKHPEIWLRISNTLHHHFHNDPRLVIDKADYNATKLLSLLQREQRILFPYLSGPKLSNYWPYILLQFTDLQLKEAHEISIIPDTHVLQSSIKLGLSDECASPIEVAAIWRDLLQDSSLTPVQMHPVLWNWSRNHFLPAV